MLWLICTRAFGSVDVFQFDSCAEREHFFENLDCADYSSVIEVSGSYEILYRSGQNK